MDEGFEMSLKAIFTMLAGVMILVFFVKFAFDQKSLQEDINIRESVVNLDDQLDAFAISSSSSKIINFPSKVNVKFECEGLQTGDYSRGDEKIIFSDEINSNEIKAWTLAWNFPFKAANFFYLTDSRRILLVYDSESFEFVDQLDFPRAFNVQKQDIRFFDADRIKSEIGDTKMTIAFFTGVSALNIKQKLQNADVITVEHQNNEIMIDGQRDFYLGEEMLYGALFDPEEYSCLKNRALSRLRDMSSIYSQKLSLVALKSSPTCRSYLIESKNTLDTFRTQDARGSLYEMMDKIDRQNKDLEKNGCQKIY